MLLSLGTLRLASLSINTHSADQEQQRPPCPKRWRAAGELASHDVERNRSCPLRNGFAMLRWYQRLGHDRQDERVVWLACQERHRDLREAAETMASRGLYGESGLAASLACSDTNITTTDRSFTSSHTIFPLTLHIAHNSPRHYSTPYDRFPFYLRIVLSLHHVVSQAAPLAAASCELPSALQTLG